MNKCIGCGTLLDNNEKELCERCFKLKNYGEYKVVDQSNSEYLTILKEINKDSLVLYVTSLLNLNFDYIKNFKNVILVLTKKDLLPKSVKDEKLITYVQNLKLNVLDIEVISSIKNYNLDKLMNKIKKYQTDNNIYVVGNTNSGKSTLINKIIKNYSDKNIDITTSLYPNTTLNKIEINLDKNMTIIDTPGLVDYHSFVHAIDFELLKKITPKKEIKPRVYQLKDKGSILVEDLFRIDYETKTPNSMVIYIANNIKISIAGKDNHNLEDLPSKTINLKDNMDIVIPDLCFIKFTKSIKLNIFIKDNVKITTRNNLI